MVKSARKLPALLAVLGVAFALLGPSNAGAEVAGARTLMESMTNEVFTTLEDSSLSPTDKERELRDVFSRNFDVPAISRFVLGRHWRVASDAQRRDFMAAFEEMNARKFLDMVGDFSEDMFLVETVRQDPDKPSLFMVNTKVGQPEGEPILVVWRVRNKGDAYRIFDVLIEGVSMAITLRHEYASVIKTDGVDGLITMMRERHAEITGQ